MKRGHGPRSHDVDRPVHPPIQGIHNGPNALADYARQAVFEVELPMDTVTRICKCLGAMPLEGNRPNWRATFKEELAQTPALQAHIDEKLGLMRAEMTRLDHLWLKETR